jgi:2-iminobutanoate/2-iminopropanoate deaminase
MTKKAISAPGAPLPIAPYSPGILIQGFLFLSGQIAIDSSTGEYTPASIETETHLVMKNIANLLAAAEMDWSHVVKASIFLKSMGDYGVVNEIYASYLGAIPPAREAVQVAQLPRDCKVEISVIASKN